MHVRVADATEDVTVVCEGPKLVCNKTYRNSLPGWNVHSNVVFVNRKSMGDVQCSNLNNHSLSFVNCYCGTLMDGSELEIWYVSGVESPVESRH